MITKIRSINVNPSFKSDSTKKNTELVEYKKSFLKEQSEKKYQEDLKKFKIDNLLGLLVGLCFSATDLIKGNNKEAGIWVAICAVVYPVSFLFKPNKSKYDNTLQMELNKLDAPKK